jgi:predicted acetyltransferase
VTIEVRIPHADELPAFFDQLSRIFSGNPFNPENFERNRALTELDRTLVASDGPQLVGTAGAFSFQMTAPGDVDVAAAGVTRVSVTATHRRRGVLRAMMRRQLDDIHARGEPLAALYASQAPIYGRFGYGVGAWHSHLVIPRARSAFRQPARDGCVRVVDGETALAVIPDLHERLRRSQPGAVGRPQAYWEARVADPSDSRQGRSELWFLLHHGDGGPDGFATYRVAPKWTGEDPGGALFVLDLLAATPAATAALWRFCLDVDLMVRLEAVSRSSEDPVRHLLADPRGARNNVYDGLWVRLVDVPAALAGRCYSAEGALTFEVRDEFCPWNAGRWELQGGPGGAECRRSEREPDLSLDVADLAAAYLGGNRFASLAAAGRVEAREKGAVQRADKLFASSPAPWCTTHF